MLGGFLQKKSAQTTWKELDWEATSQREVQMEQPRCVPESRTKLFTGPLFPHHASLGSGRLMGAKYSLYISQYKYNLQYLITILLIT